MKPFYKFLTIIALFTLPLNTVYADCLPDDPDCTGTGDLPQPGDGTGAYSPATPIDEYAGLLIIAGVVAAGVIYSNKEKMILKK